MSKDKPQHIRGPVRCIETGVIYKNARAACKALGRTPCAMANHLAGRAPHVKGLHFERLPEPARTMKI